MAYKNSADFTTISLKKDTKQRLDALKVHPRQSVEEVLEQLVNEKLKTGSQSGQTSPPLLSRSNVALLKKNQYHQYSTEKRSLDVGGIPDKGVMESPHEKTSWQEHTQFESKQALLGA